MIECAEQCPKFPSVPVQSPSKWKSIFSRMQDIYARECNDEDSEDESAVKVCLVLICKIWCYSAPTYCLLDRKCSEKCTSYFLRMFTRNV